MTATIFEQHHASLTRIKNRKNAMKKNDEIIFSLCIEDLQNEAKNMIGKCLDEDELNRAIELIQYGIGENMIIMYDNVFNEIVNDRNSITV